MIQFNLLPDVKLEYLKARRTQRLVIGTSVVLIAASLFVFVLLIGTVDVFQKKNLHDLNNDIQKYSAQINSTPNLNKILTIQSQLSALTGLHNEKPVASRLFGYIKQLTPTSASISELDTDFTQHTVTITGAASSLDVVNKYADTLKFTTYTKPGGSSTNAFSDVTLSSFSRTTTGASYTITLNFDPTIFDNANNVNLTVPNIISTRSVTQQPSDLFQSATNSGSQ